jgi:hypothetical protein
MAGEFRADPRVRELSRGAAGPVWGIVVVANWPPPQALVDRHEQATALMLAVSACTARAVRFVMRQPQLLSRTDVAALAFARSLLSPMSS